LESNDEIQVAPKNVESKSKEPESMDQDRHEKFDDHEIVESLRATILDT